MSNSILLPLLLFGVVAVIVVFVIIVVHHDVGNFNKTTSSSASSSWYPSFLRGVAPRPSSSTEFGNTIDSRLLVESHNDCLSFVTTDNLYQFQDMHTGLALHVVNDSKYPGASIFKKTISGDGGGGASYKWRLQVSGNGQYYVVNANSGLAMTLTDESYSNDPSNNVIQLPITEDDSISSWCFRDGGGGSYKAFIQSTGHVMVVSSTKQWLIIPVATKSSETSLTDSSSSLEMWGSSGLSPDSGLSYGSESGVSSASSRSLSAESSSPAITTCNSFNANFLYRITARHSGKHLQIIGDSTAKAKVVVQNPIRQGAMSYEWRLKSVSGDHYRLINDNSGLDIRVRSASIQPGALIQQHTPNMDSHGNFCFEHVEGWYYKIKIQKSGMYLDVPGNSYADGTKIEQTQSADDLSQQFLVTPIQKDMVDSGKWNGPYQIPLVAAAIANLDNGDILMWSAFAKDTFGGNGKTWTAIYDPNTNTAKAKRITNTQHDMFCPGTVVLQDRRVMITGGSDSEATTIYNPTDNSWTRGSDMNIQRGYQSMTVLSDGSVFTLGGSFSGGLGDKHGEVWNPQSEQWRLKPGILCEGSLLTTDIQSIYRSDNHMWLFTAPNGMVFHAGPANRMHWIDTAGEGRVTGSKTRGGGHAMNGNAVMYDKGKILVLGGAPNYASGDAYNTAFTIDINGGKGKEVIARTGNMISPRTFSTSVVLPSGEVVVVGGVTVAAIFTDLNHVLFAEIWNPRTGKFLPLDTMKTPRTYHSVAILMKDGRVLVAGGGLCMSFCPEEYNHFDVEILTPPYLLNKDGSRKKRPSIQSAPTKVKKGATISVAMNTGESHTFALMRLGAVTHSVNNDVRRMLLTVENKSGSNFKLKVPSNPSVALPGTYFLFAMNANGTPSVARAISITT